MIRVAVVSICTVLVAPLGSVAASAAHLPGCPRGYDMGLLTLDEAADLLLDQGVPATRGEVLTRLSARDSNGDRGLCAKDLPDTEGIATYAYHYTDNRKA